MSQYYNLRSTINSALKCRSHKNRLFSSILFFKSGVISLVRKTTRSHSLRAVTFNAFVSSPSRKRNLKQRKTALSTSRTAKKCTVSTRHCVATEKFLNSREKAVCSKISVLQYSSHITTYFLFVTHALNSARDLSYREQ